VASIIDHAKWLQRGKQRNAVAQVLLKPMTPSQILAESRKLNPLIQLRDVWRLLGEFDREGLTFCINPDQVTGKIYFLTDLGKAVVDAAFGKEAAPLPTDIDWDAYARLARGKVRRLVALELARPSGPGQAGKTTSELRKNLLSSNPIGHGVVSGCQHPAVGVDQASD
jgi:hypothetical protein